MSNQETTYTLDQLSSNIEQALSALDEAEAKENSARRLVSDCRNRLSDWQRLYDVKILEDRKRFAKSMSHWPVN
jgi:hypothetical protein